MTTQTCPSCNTDYADHPGLIPTCADLQRARKEIARLRLRLKELELERLNRARTERMKKHARV